jgi:TRAP-type mannitol/chloroaromatic compound transport system permease small subunit
MLSWTSFEGSPESDGIQGIFILKTLVSIFALTLLMQGLAIASRAVLFLTDQPVPDLPEHIDPLFEEHEYHEAGL